MKSLDSHPIFNMSLDGMDYDQLVVLTRLLLNAMENYGNDERPNEMAECDELLGRVRDRRAELISSELD